MSPPNFGIALHAGTSDMWRNDLSYQRKIENILQGIANTAGAKLRSGEAAVDVVRTVVRSLEDCPFFNAGKGAVLNQDGEHEVSGDPQKCQLL